MKTQMRVQKILMLVSLILSALTFVFALYFLTGSMGRVWFYCSGGSDLINGQKFMDASQSFVGTLVALSIVMIVLVAVMYIMGCHKRRNYYITNYIAIGLFVVFEIVVVIYMVIGISNVMNLFLNDIAWESGTGLAGIYNVADQFDTQNPIYKEYANFIIGFALCAILVADAVLVALSTVWKVKLMKGEKQLLEMGKAVSEEPVKEVSEAEPVQEEV